MVDALPELARALWPAPGWLLALALLISLLAGVVRGFAGFGYSALVVAGLAPFVAPGPVVIAVLLLEVLASLRLVRSTAMDVDRVWHRALLIGNFVFVPLGLVGLGWLQPDVVRVAVSAMVLLGATGVRLTMGRMLSPSAALRGWAGVFSGLLNGFAASGGIVAALLMAAAGVRPQVLRSTMINVLLWISSYALVCGGALSLVHDAELVGWQTVGWAVLLWPAMAVGMRLGGSAFSRSAPGNQTRMVLDVLILAALAGFATALLRQA